MGIAENIAQLQALQRSDPFAYNFYYGNSTPQQVAQGQSTGYITNQSAFGTGGTVDYQGALDAARLAAQGSSSSGSTAAASAASAPPPPPSYSGPTATQKLEALLPSGFEQSYVPGGFGQSTLETLVGTGRGKAQEFIDTLLKRKTLTGTGASKAATTLGTQEAGARTKLTELRDALLEKERGTLRGIAGGGYSAAGGQSGEFFDPSPYQQQVQSEASRFQGAFPGELTSAAGDVSGLFDTSALGGAGGVVSGPQNIQYDPYAQEGGKLTTGLEETGAPPPSKKRSTAVF